MFPAKIYIGQIAVVFGIVVISTWGATQWAAHALGYQEGLGSPWLALAGYPVYLPWRLFEWWFSNFAHVLVVQVDQIAKCANVPDRAWLGRSIAVDVALHVERPFFTILRRRNVSAT
jgi:type IV secretory pathway TraG/TraD family ATPase VirD4